MAWIILFLLITAAVIVDKVINKKYFYTPDIVLLAVASMLLSIIVGYLLLILTGCILSGVFNIPISEHTDTSQSLIALKDNNEIQGDSFLGCGSVGSTQYYYYLTNTDKGIHQEKVESKDVFLKYSDDNPRIVKHSYDWENPAWNWLGLCMKKSDYTVFVPADGITTEFKIDME